MKGFIVLGSVALTFILCANYPEHGWWIFILGSIIGSSLFDWSNQPKSKP
jgi:hypothetical protein